MKAIVYRASKEFHYIDVAEQIVPGPSLRLSSGSNSLITLMRWRSPVKKGR
jgi:hypothetical protein